MVSILLRILEYYDGILILTTNRTRAIDHAVLSRVTMAVLYQRLDDRARTHIFKSFVGQITHEPSRKTLLNWFENEEWAKSFERYPLNELNARQIRNVLMAVSSMAVHNHDKEIKIDDLHQILKVVIRFQRQSQAWQDNAAKKAVFDEA
jgi:SpoVK/Ycf46/Vps4 family AAA+-type ATPase